MHTYYDDKWLALRDEINRRGANGNAVVEALQDYYTVFEDRILIWLAELFDPDIGGFYYSESARDNEVIHYNDNTYLLLPDIESTSQATNYLHSNGIFREWSDFPAWMIQKMAKFICERQDPETGLFYHPQWPKEFTNTKPSRVGRDNMWAISMANKYGFKLPYPTANERLEKSAEKGEDASASFPEHLRSEKNYLDYLHSLNWDTRAYHSGNQVAAQYTMIQAAGYADATVRFFNSIQNPETGLWGSTRGSDAVNAFLKISCFYEGVNLPIPHAEKAALEAMECAASREIAGSTCAQYNCWFSLNNIVQNIRRFGGAEGKRTADELIVTMLNNASEAIYSTKIKALAFKKDKGCFSMAPNESSGTSQGMPVAIFHTNEGDINANGICSSGTARNMLMALELIDFMVPIFSPKGQEIFLSALRLPKEMQ